MSRLQTMLTSHPFKKIFSSAPCNIRIDFYLLELSMNTVTDWLKTEP